MATTQTMRIGPRSRGPREPHAEDLRPHQREVVAGRDEVAGEEDRERDLRDLAGLERERPDVDPDACVQAVAPDTRARSGRSSSTIDTNIAM